MAHQLNMEKKYHALVIGGVNADIWGAPAGIFRLHDSNPGFVNVKPGGVGRNIAHNLSLLGIEVSMITAFGGDAFSSFLQREVAAVGIDASLALHLPDLRSSIYLYITDDTGDMHVAISDMDITSHITPDYLQKHLTEINSFDAVIIDANLPEETIVYAAEHITAPIYADPVSTTKAIKLKSVLSSLRMLKPNMLEAEILAGEYSAEAAATKLASLGVSRVFVSDGLFGITATDGSTVSHIPAVPAVSVNATGAGDASTAALIYADLHGYSMEDAALLAAKAGALTVSCEETNAPNLADILL